MLTRFLIAVLVVLCLSVTPVRADRIDGNWLHQVCHDGNDPQAPTACSSYITGLSDASHPAIATNLLGLTGYCRPEGVTRGQIMDIVKKYLAGHPEERHLPAVVLYYHAIIEAFPCTTGN